jgi:hypothetical protein
MYVSAAGLLWHILPKCRFKEAEAAKNDKQTNWIIIMVLSQQHPNDG